MTGGERRGEGRGGGTRQGPLRSTHTHRSTITMARRVSRHHRVSAQESRSGMGRRGEGSEKVGPDGLHTHAHAHRQTDTHTKTPGGRGEEEEKERGNEGGTQHTRESRDAGRVNTQRGSSEDGGTVGGGTVGGHPTHEDIGDQVFSFFDVVVVTVVMGAARCGPPHGRDVPHTSLVGFSLPPPNPTA